MIKVKEKERLALAGGRSHGITKQARCLISDSDYSTNHEHNKASEKRSCLVSDQSSHGLLENTYEYNFRNSASKRFSMLSGIKKLRGMDRFRVSKCMNFYPKQGGKAEVELVRAGDRLRFLNVEPCGSVWLCPVCNSRISYERRRELQYAVKESGAHVALLTITLSHAKHDRLSDVIKALRKAVNSTKSGRWYEAWLKENNIIASASSFEITHGRYGWHPHLHILLFMDQEPSPGRIRDQFSERFTRFLAKNGAYASAFHGVNVKCSEKDISGYIAKWNATDELTQVQAKHGRGESLTVWEIAKLAINGDREAEKLWLEYAKATYRKKALTWSRGAKDLFGLSELSDEEIASMNYPDPDDEEPVHVVSFAPSEWYFILDRGLIGEVHHQARIGGAQAVNELMIRIRGAPLKEFLETSDNFIQGDHL